MKGLKIWFENKDRETDVREEKISDARLKGPDLLPVFSFFSFFRLLEFTTDLRGEL